jgi:hypothetical protein
MSFWDRGRLRHSVGIETKGGRFTPLIPKGVPLPTSVTETFTTADPDQASIKLKPFRGESQRVSLNKGLGLFEVTEIPWPVRASRRSTSPSTWMLEGSSASPPGTRSPAATCPCCDANGTADCAATAPGSECDDGAAAQAAGFHQAVGLGGALGRV